MTAWRLLSVCLGRRTLALALLLGASAELCAAALIGTSGWFLATCAVVTVQADTTWSWMYPSGAVRALALLRTGLRYLERLTSHRLVLDATVALRARLVAGAAALTPRELRRRRDGELLGLLTADVETVASVPAQVLVPLVSQGVVMATVVLLIFRTGVAPGVAELLVLAIGVAGVAHARRRTGRLLQRAARSRAVARAELLGSRAALAELRCLAAVPGARQAVEHALSDAERAEAAAARSERMARLGLRVLGALQGSVLLLLMSTESTHQSIGRTVGAFLLLGAGWELLEGLPRLLEHLSDATSAARRLGVLGEGQRPRTGPVTVTGPLTVTGLPLPAREDPLSMNLGPGDVCLVTGPNGSGKSTLLATLAGHMPAPSGDVRIGGSSVRSLTASDVAQALTLVETDDWLADDTVAANLRQAAAEAGPEVLRAALRHVGLGHLSLDRAVGPRGTALSQGQRRRLTIARAALRRPQILLLDEPTAGLDEQTATGMLRDLRAALPDTAMVIAMQEQERARLPWSATLNVRLGASSLVSARTG